MYQEQSSIQLIGELSQNVIVHDLSFDWAGKRIAAACSDKLIRIYHRKLEGWVEENKIKIQGASVWKVKWARPEFGTIIATCSLDRNVRIYEYKKVEKIEGGISEWIPIHNLQENKSVEDIKFAPSKHLGLCLAIASSDGTLKIHTAENPLKLREWGGNYSILINDLGLSCLSWSKNQLKEDQALIAVGCKSVETTPRRVLEGMRKGNNQEPFKLDSANTVSFVRFYNTPEKKMAQKINVPGIKETKSINDISWALMNGRSYYLLAIASDAFMKVFEISVKESLNIPLSIEVLKQIKLCEEPCYRVSWNVMGTYVSACEKKKVKIWRAFARGKWSEVKEIEDS